MRILVLMISMTLLGHRLSGQIRIDHVIVVVSDIEAAKKAYSTLGFSIKEGRLHENGLLNAHIKFVNGTSFELMTIHNATADALAKQYQSLLDKGEGGVYLALTGHQHDSLKVLFTEMEIEFTETKGKLWSYLAFPTDSYLAHLFFIDYYFDTNNLNDPTDHLNGLNSIQTVEIEGGQKVRQFFEHMGLKLDEKTSAFPTSTGDIRLIQRANEKNRPRLVSITFAGVATDSLEINWRK